MDRKICIFLILSYATLSVAISHCKLVLRNLDNDYSVVCQGVSAPNDFPSDIDYTAYNSEHLLCKNCHLETLSSDLLHPIREVEVLNISHSDVQVIQNSAFKDFTRIRDIYIEKNPKIKISVGAFQGLKSLSGIILENNEIKDLTPGFADKLDVDYFSLAHNEIEEIPNEAFKGATKIGRLELSNNKIKTLHIDSFKGLEIARNVILHHNNLQDIPLGVFKNLRVNWFRLDYNPLIKIAPGTFSGLMADEMYLSNDNIKNLPVGFAENLNVVYLNLANNKIEEIPSNVFKGVTNLSEVDLSHNKIKTLYSDSFKGFGSDLRGRKHIDLSYNEIKEIPDSIFKDLGSLFEVKLSYNKIEKIAPDTFSGLESTSHLELEHNSLRVMPVDAFKKLDKLIKLNLANNKLENFQNGAFTGLENLQTLVLAGNSLTSFEGEKLYSLKKLENLDISGNQIYKLSAASVLSFAPNLKVINLEDNLYQCSELIDIVKGFNEKGVKTEPKMKKNDVRNVEGIACIHQPVDASTTKESFLKQATEKAN